MAFIELPIIYRKIDETEEEKMRELRSLGLPLPNEEEDEPEEEVLVTILNTSAIVRAFDVDGDGKRTTIILVGGQYCMTPMSLGSFYDLLGKSL